MNRERAKELLPIIEAFANGETIQHFHLNDIWFDDDDPRFGDNKALFRIKPQPREFWVFDGNDEPIIRDAPIAEFAHKWFKVREVIE